MPHPDGDISGLVQVGRLNARWNEEVAAGDEDARFERASAVAGEEFAAQLEGLTASWLPARDLVQTALVGRGKVHESGQILAFESAGMPWKDHLYALEKVHAVELLVMFVVYEDSAKMWRVQAVTEEGQAFKNRCLSWRP